MRVIEREERVKSARAQLAHVVGHSAALGASLLEDATSQKSVGDLTA
jgi:hypothetical protein